LVREQGSVCCYCGERIEARNSHIEHFRPRSRFPGLALDYSNLLASCQGETEEAHARQIHCGHKKGDWYDERLTISPLAPDCEGYFRYTSAGEILPVDDRTRHIPARETIRHLGLDCESLTAARKKAFEPVLDIMDSLSEEDGRELLRQYNEEDRSGRYTPFCDVIVYLLGVYFPDDTD